ncbi:MAG: TrkA family potassium uptake protein [Negativibacillus sp.]|nr:TrkA family potassium uptake protein [Negativibacillus sp.]
MNIIVIGGGKVGFYLCKTLIEHGHQPLIIEKNKQTCEYLSNQLDISAINADGSTIEALTSANASKADSVIAVTGQDQDNLISCQLAKKIFHVPKTVARVNNPKNAEVMKKLGVDIPISSTDNIARLLEREVDTARIKSLLSLNRGEASLCELMIPDNYVLSGKRLFELDIPEDAVIAAIFRQDKLIIPRGNAQIISGDKVLVIAKDRIIHELSASLQLK